MDVHDRGMLYYRLLKQDVKQAQKIVCGQAHLVAEKNTVIPRVSMKRANVVIHVEVCCHAGLGHISTLTCTQLQNSY